MFTLEDIERWCKEHLNYEERAYDWLGQPYSSNHSYYEAILSFIKEYRDKIKNG